METDRLTHEYPQCRRILGDLAWDRLLAALGCSDPRSFIRRLKDNYEKFGLPDYVPDAALLEMTFSDFRRKARPVPPEADSLIVNPALVLLPVQWTGLPSFLGLGQASRKGDPKYKEGHVLIWRHPVDGDIRCREAAADDLLALKLVAESVDLREAARHGHTSVRQMLAILYRGIGQGLLIGPEPGIRRGTSVFEGDSGRFMTADTFTLQWHITQACDLNCRHCYDRSDRTRLPLPEARAVLEDFFDFTRAMHVRGHVTFTGGNPLLYPEFPELYGHAAEMGFSTAILGNPAGAGILDAILDIQPLTHYQISLEGLAPYNDYIRGAGHFKRALAFLDLLREKNIHAVVMLTLNRDNMDQVLPLAEILRGRADRFTFNRLAMVGEGKQLQLPDPDAYRAFLAAYLEAAAANPAMTLKDNLFSILEERPTGGCTGFGCGAAFNFVSLLSDGEVHACRKFPSKIGNIRESSLLDIFNSDPARKYRNGSAACRGCRLFAACRGCPAVVHGMGLDSFESRDPFCFYAHAPGLPGA